MAHQQGQGQPQQASLDAPPTQWKPLYLSEFSPCFRFRPHGRTLVAYYLAPMALCGRVPDDVCADAVADGVDVYGTRPEALPFASRNHDQYGKVWGYFFTTRPAAAVASGGAGGSDVWQEVPGGFWARYGVEKAYSNEDGDAIALRSRFAFYDEEDTLTPWRMKEFRLNEDAAVFRDLTFHPIAKDLVACKVYNHVEIPEEPPLVNYHSSDDDNNGEDEAEEVALEDPVHVGDVAAAYV